MPFLDLDGTIEYTRVGSGHPFAPTLVFLHEGLGSIAQWRDFPARVARETGSNAVIYSRRGYGHSGPVTGPRPVRFMHDEALVTLPALLARLEIDRPILVGHSDGASIALIFAAHHPDQARSLILEAPHVVVEDQTVRGIADARHAFEHGSLRKALLKHHGGNTDAMFTSWADVWLSEGFRSWSIVEELASVRCPVLVIQGEDDQYGTWRQVDLIAQRVGGPVRTLALPGCGHDPHRERQAIVLHAMRSLIATTA